MRRSALLPIAATVLGLGLAPELGCWATFDGYSALDERADATNGTGGNSRSGADASVGGVAGRAAGGASVSGGGAGTAGVSANGGTSGGAVGAGGVGGAGMGGGGGAGTGGAGTGGAGTGGAGTGGAGTGGAGTGGAGTGGAGTGGAATCPLGLSGPPMIEIPRAGGKGIFCIDRTEVTNEDYAAFLATAPSTVFQPQQCSSNTSYVPATSSACTLLQYDPTGKPRVPVSCIDWCDARKYCEWAGKRLCGNIAGGATLPSQFADATKDQWVSACTKGGTRAFPYGDAYQGTSCAGIDYPGTHAIPVANLPNCQGGYVGLYDMSGNVAEWEDSCTASAGAADPCLARGGSLFDSDGSAPTLRCNSSVANAATPTPATFRRDSRSEFIGVRCCYDP